MGLSSREARYMSQFDSDLKALLASGYLIEVPIAVTNWAGQFAQATSRSGKALNGTGAYLCARVQSNLVFVTCRPQYAPLWR
jgi:hypothetical protein